MNAYIVYNDINAHYVNKRQADVVMLGYILLSSSVVVEQMTLHSNRVLSCCGTQIPQAQSVTLRFPLVIEPFYRTHLARNTIPRNKLISDKLLNSPCLMI